ncbi:MAG: response regulator transcription factor [Flavobacteriales bacterium]|nr:response regulator transcription factor [Flavobacteriales bacterium]
MPHDLALVDDHHLMRSGLAAMLNGLDGYRVTIEAANGRELIEALRDATPPAIAIVDLNMPVMDGYATIGWLRTNAPGDPAARAHLRCRGRCLGARNAGRGPGLRAEERTPPRIARRTGFIGAHRVLPQRGGA